MRLILALALAASSALNAYMFYALLGAARRERSVMADYRRWLDIQNENAAG